MAADTNGNALITGTTYSSDFPTPNGFDTTYGGESPNRMGGDAFVARVSSAGQLQWASYLGGWGSDDGKGIAADAAGNALIAGHTMSPNFPTSGGFDTTYNGSGTYDAFVAKVTASGNLAWGSFLGGGGNDFGSGIGVDAAGQSLVTGGTASSDFPATGVLGTTLSGGNAAFVVKVSASGQLQWSGFLGGSGTDTGRAIAMDVAGNALLTGLTRSYDFPTPGGFDTTKDGSEDAFVAKVTGSGQLEWASFLGGSDRDEGHGISSDAVGNVFITGHTESFDFPTPGWGDTSYNGDGDAFVAKVSATGQLQRGTFLGGGRHDWGRAIAVDTAGGALVAGYTESSDFPTPDGFDMTYGGVCDAFVAKISFSLDLTVLSTPISGVNIGGDRPGTTEYTVDCDYEEEVQLIAPPTVIQADQEYGFVRWVVDGIEGVREETSVQITMDANHTAEARYRLLGDVTGDCAVNVLDMINVRNHLYDDVGSGDNWRYDLTGDGMINVLDMLVVRNNVRNRCPE